MSATESLASVDTVCVDKTGTLTAGELRLTAVEYADGVDPEAGAAALGRFAASAGNRNRTLETIAAEFPGKPGTVRGEVPFSSEWKWSGVSLDGGSDGATYVLGAPDILAESGALSLPPRLAEKLEEETAAGRRVVAFGQTQRGAARGPGRQRSAAADAAGAGRAGGDAAARRRRDDRLHARGGSRPEADLRRRRRDRNRGRLRGRRAAGRRGDRGAGPARGRGGPGEGGAARTRSSAGSSPSRRKRWSGRWSPRGATWR